MGLPDSRSGTFPGYVFPFTLAAFAAALAGLPGSSTDLSTRAAPNHPGKPSGCLPVASPPVSGFILVGGLAPSVFLSRPNRVHLRCGSRVRPLPMLRQMDCSIPRSLGYMSEQAIYMVNSFQFTRSARLILAYRQRGKIDPKRNRRQRYSVQGSDGA